jgi:hypothetical protein
VPRVSVKSRVLEWLKSQALERVEPEHFAQLLSDLAPAADSTIRRALRESGIPMAPLVEGVRQNTLDDLHRTLNAMAAEYERDPKQVRSAVLVARQHAEWNLRRQPGDALREEAFLWIRTWLENPGVFESWARLRRGQIEEN